MRTILGKNENNHEGTRVSTVSIVDGIRDEISDGFSDSIALPEERPTRRSVTNALWLIGIIEELGDKGDDNGDGELLRGLQAWPSNNCTIELGDRVDEGTQYILEAGDKGVSGFVRTGGDTVHICPTSSVSAIKSLLAEWYEVASGMRAE